MERKSDILWGNRDESLRLAIPSDGELHESTLGFLRSCGTPVKRASSRRYTAELAAMPGVSVLFQRSADIPSKVDEGSADLGIVGLDRFLESRQEDRDSLVIVDDLDFGRCELVVAIPEGWIDIASITDLADLAVELRESSRDLRVATKYPRLVSRFLHQRGINYFTLAPSSGTLEAAPAMGFADVIADIVATGVTLRENRLKTLEGGTVLVSQACLIGNRATLAASERKLARTRALLERIEARLRAEDFYRVTANVWGESREAVAQHVLRRSELAGMRGPTVSEVYSAQEDNWYAVTVLVAKERLLETVDHLREMGGSGITVFRANYLFQDTCQAYEALLKALALGQALRVEHRSDASDSNSLSESPQGGQGNASEAGPGDSPGSQL